MKPVDQFLQSVREGFNRNQAGDWTQIGLLLVAAIALAIALTIWLGRWSKRRAVQRRIDAAAATARLKRSELDYLTGIATAAGHTLLEVMTGLGPFERATAIALGSEAPLPRPAEGSAFERVRHLRLALGFSPLPAHHWLLSTRELVVGDRVALVGVAAAVADVNEASFAVDLPASPAPAVGSVAKLAIVRADDSRYMSSLRVLATELVGADAGAVTPWRRVFFGHDEQPERQQNREHVRVRVRGPVSVRIMDAPRPPTSRGIAVGPAGPVAAPARTEATYVGTMADVSAGGLSLNLPLASEAPIPQGARMRCSFSLGEGDAFEMLAAVVSDAGAGPGSGVQHIRAAFTSLGDAERDRLASAVTRLQLRPPSDGDVGGA